MKKQIHKLKKSACLSCGVVMDMSVVSDSSEKEPEVGDVVLCLSCGYPMAFTEDWGVRELNDEEVIEIAGDKDFLNAQKFRAQHIEKMRRMGERPKQVESIHVFVELEGEYEKVIYAVDPDGQIIPLICYNQEMIENARPAARHIAKLSGNKVKLLRFTAREEVEEFCPGPGGNSMPGWGANF